MTSPLDRDLRALLYSEKDAHRRVRNQLWLRFLIPLAAAIVVVASLAALAGSANAGGVSALAGTAVIFLAIIGLITGWVVVIAAVFTAGLIQDLSTGLFFWTTRARGFSTVLFFRIRSLSDSVAHFVVQTSAFTAIIQTGIRGLAEIGYSIRSAWMRNHHG